MPTLAKLLAITFGSGWVMVAQADMSGQNIHEYGGWGLAVAGLFTLWREFKEERKKRDVITELYHEKSEMRDKEMAKSNEAVIRFMDETSRSIQSMKDAQKEKCLAFEALNQNQRS